MRNSHAYLWNHLRGSAGGAPIPLSADLCRLTLLDLSLCSSEPLCLRIMLLCFLLLCRSGLCFSFFCFFFAPLRLCVKIFLSNNLFYLILFVLLRAFVSPCHAFVFCFFAVQAFALRAFLSFAFPLRLCAFTSKLIILLHNTKKTPPKSPNYGAFRGRAHYPGYISPSHKNYFASVSLRKLLSTAEPGINGICPSG